MKTNNLTPKAMKARIKINNIYFFIFFDILNILPPCFAALSFRYTNSQATLQHAVHTPE